MAPRGIQTYSDHNPGHHPSAWLTATPSLVFHLQQLLLRQPEQTIQNIELLWFPHLKSSQTPIVFRIKSKLLLHNSTFPAFWFAVLTLYSGLQPQKTFSRSLYRTCLSHFQTSTLTCVSTYNTMASQCLGKLLLFTDWNFGTQLRSPSLSNKLKSPPRSYKLTQNRTDCFKYKSDHLTPILNPEWLLFTFKTKPSSPWSAKHPVLTSVHFHPHSLPVSPSLCSSHAGLLAVLQTHDASFWPHGPFTCRLLYLEQTFPRYLQSWSLTSLRILLNHHSLGMSSSPPPQQNRPPHSFPFSFITSS